MIAGSPKVGILDLCSDDRFKSRTHWAGNTFDLINLAKPVRFSLKIGFFLCGIADEPFCFLPKNSSTSKTSVLCKCLISIANLSIELAIIPRVEKN